MFANLSRLPMLTLLVSALAASAALAAPPAPSPNKDKPAPAEQAAPAAAAQLKLSDVAPHIQWYRGKYERDATGFQFTIPSGFHLADNVDGRAIEMAMGRPDDTQLIALLTLLNVPITNPQTWIVRVRWMGDGVVIINADDLDAAKLEAAAAKPAEARLASSGGHFVRFAAAPERHDHDVSWIEERTPASGKGSVFDCHAVHLARRGFLEFSIIGVNEGVKKNCDATLHLFTDDLKFDEAHDYPAQIGTLPKAPYSLTSLVAQTK